MTIDVLPLIRKCKRAWNRPKVVRRELWNLLSTPPPPEVGKESSAWVNDRVDFVDKIHPEISFLMTRIETYEAEANVLIDELRSLIYNLNADDKLDIIISTPFRLVHYEGGRITNSQDGYPWFRYGSRIFCVALNRISKIEPRRSFYLNPEVVMNMLIIRQWLRNVIIQWRKRKDMA